MNTNLLPPTSTSAALVSGVDSPSVATATLAPAQKSGAASPSWPALFAGQTLLRACPARPKDDPCAGCRLRALCRCAQENFAAATRIETRVWLVLAVCGAAAILYAFLNS